MSAPQHPYQVQPDRAFWRRAVANVHPLDIGGWYRRKFELGTRPVATAGSCFAQHIGRQLREKGFRYLDVEPAPRFLAPASRADFGHEIYSARYGNVYTTRQLRQLFERAHGTFEPVEDHWVHGDGVVDPFRPTIQPEPFGSVEELRRHRREHLGAVTRILEEAGTFVFTLGLTETWVHREDGAVYPVAPGTAGGTWDPARYRFANLTHAEVMADLVFVIELARAINPAIRFLLTVSPVPLMATATPHHVVSATSYSKSVLRAVAGELADAHAHVDYFPSFEIIASTPMHGQFYEPDQRSVSMHGVRHVMQQFFEAHPPPERAAAAARRGAEVREGDDDDAARDVVCDEELLRVFGA